MAFADIEYDIIKAAIDSIGPQIAAIEKQIAIIEADNAKLQKMVDDLTAEAATQVIVSPALPSAAAPIVTAAIAPTPTLVAAAVSPEVRGQPGIAPTAEVVTPEAAAAAAVPEALLAGMPSWTWILIAGAAVFLLFGGKGIEGVEGKKPRRVKRRK